MAEQTIAFEAEIEQLLDILVHSLYTERAVFLRELLSNASDALHRFKLESLTAEAVLDPTAELGIWVRADAEAGTLSVRDTGVGMTRETMARDLGTVAHSGARAFTDAMERAAGTGGPEPSDERPEPAAGRDERAPSAADLIGRFGVGFYSIFMVASEAEVVSRSFRPDAEGAVWRSSGRGSYTLDDADVAERGTVVRLTLRDDAREFLEFQVLRDAIRTRSNYIPFPVHLFDPEKGDYVLANARTAPWRERPEDLSAEQHAAFLEQLRPGAGAPLLTVHFRVDAPLQLHALLYVPSHRDPMLMREPQGDGLQLYARKVLIDEHRRDLLPNWLRFVVGVVDSEDLPLNVSRESVQATPAMARIRNVLTKRVVSELAALPEADPERFERFLEGYAPFLKESVATDPTHDERVVELLRFRSTKEDETSLAAYVERMGHDQTDIYFVLADDVESALASAHLDAFLKRDLEVLLFTEPLDAFIPMGLPRYRQHALRDVSEADLELPDGPVAETDDQEAEVAEAGEPAARDGGEAFAALLERARTVLGERVSGVRESRLLERGAARLVAAAGVPASIERLRRLTDEHFDVPPRVLELNPRNPLVRELARRLEADPTDDLTDALLTQLFEAQLLAEGLHPNPAAMAARLERVLTAASRAPLEASATAGEAEEAEIPAADTGD